MIDPICSSATYSNRPKFRETMLRSFLPAGCILLLAIACVVIPVTADNTTVTTTVQTTIPTTTPTTVSTTVPTTTDTTVTTTVVTTQITAAAATTAALPVAAFSASPTTGTAPLAVQFTDASSGSPTAWNWNFGDGNTSTSQSPSFTYASAGTYTVSLTASNAGGSSANTATQTITVSPAVPVAGFSCDVSSGVAPLTVQFTDTSTNSPTSWSWDFGDGNTSTEQDPSFTYATPGTYTVSLTATNSAGSNTCTETSLVSVTSSVTQPMAAFSADILSGTAPLTVQFTDESSNTPASWSWNFGDGESGTDQNPSHIYTTTGTYTVSLTATNAAGSNTTTTEGYISVAAAQETTAPPATTAVPAFTYSSVNAGTTTESSEEAWLEQENAKISPAATATKARSPGFGTVAALAGGCGGVVLLRLRRKR